MASYPLTHNELLLNGLAGLPAPGTVVVEPPGLLTEEDVRAIVAIAHELADLPVVRIRVMDRGLTRASASSGRPVLAEAPERWTGEMERVRTWMLVRRQSDPNAPLDALRCGTWTASRAGLHERREIVFEDGGRRFEFEAPELDAVEARELVLSLGSQPLRLADTGCAQTREWLRSRWPARPQPSFVRKYGNEIQFWMNGIWRARQEAGGWTVVGYRSLDDD